MDGDELVWGMLSILGGVIVGVIGILMWSGVIDTSLALQPGDPLFGTWVQFINDAKEALLLAIPGVLVIVAILFSWLQDF